MNEFPRISPYFHMRVPARSAIALRVLVLASVGALTVAGCDGTTKGSTSGSSGGSGGDTSTTSSGGTGDTTTSLTGGGTGGDTGGTTAGGGGTGGDTGGTITGGGGTGGDTGGTITGGGGTGGDTSTTTTTTGVTTCASSGLDCGPHGTCDDGMGTPLCACSTGYSGPDCATCAAGYQDLDLDGTCAPDCATAALSCGENASCDDSSGAALCSCLAGYQDNDNNSTCLPTCAMVSCGANAGCADGSGTALCSCLAGYQDNDNNGTCLPSCAALPCAANSACNDSSGTATCTVPATCAEIKANTPNAADGPYTLYIGHDAAKPWPVYCHSMAGTPQEFLELPNTGGNYNYSQYSSGGYSPGTSVRTSYTRIRIDPVTLTVEMKNQTFATSTGQLQHVGGQTVTSMPFGVAMSCGWLIQGLGNINLTGTPFKVIDPFCGDGWQANYGAAFSANNQIVQLGAVGECGWISPAPCMADPFNAKGDFVLDLAYIGP